MSIFDEQPEAQWVGDEAGPIVRPYILTRGRTEPTRGRFDLITLVVTIRQVSSREPGLDPECLAIVRLCQLAQSVAEIAAHMNLPAGTVRVLLSDLLDQGFIAIQEPHSETDMHDERLYRAVLDGLRAL
ncbi:MULTISPECIES: DUF742 domain-containing protein [unclassified Streptosporangium]|uniref:DUF742 domain-containing protein n=1 Tax=unclassified Streptosporangium TaxID=2632669 RepID=UPI002DDC6921|nr:MULTISPECIES: DUF742 domain-containing protein [unclassified Streptosporangium]WSA27967.1 DUF742 domain-containing protein [Streptosporangium sp. NBC_01810]WSD00562.1 DUF742 domain-containing protein [Streptosporangium sp. NBC_01755]